MTKARKMSLGAFLWPYGHHVAAWRHPNAPIKADFGYFADIAKTAERGCLDMLFLADTLSVWAGDAASLHRQSYVAWLEPHTLLSALSTVTKNVGLICTASTTYDQPYLLARKFAALDCVSNGRAGWNLVTSSNPNESLNFGVDGPLTRDERYRRAREFAEVVVGLWDSWDQDAFVRDRASGAYFAPEKMHVLNHKGNYYNVQGPLNVERSPQARPILVQAGSSDDGKDLAADFAEVVFTAHSEIGSARDFYADVKARAEKAGRAADSIKIMPGFAFTVARTRQEAEDLHGSLQELIHPEIGLKLLSTFIGHDLSGCDVDGPLPQLERKVTGGSRTALLVNLAHKEGLTIRQLYMRIAGNRGHFQVVGDARDVADTLEEWFTTGAADGFNVMPPLLPGSLNAFVDLVVPELQKRGLFRTAYSGTTLRENLGLPMPVSRYAT